MPACAVVVVSLVVAARGDSGDTNFERLTHADAELWNVKKCPAEREREREREREKEAKKEKKNHLFID